MIRTSGSTIRGVDYTNDQLSIVFASGKKRPDIFGKQYFYKDVPREIYEGLVERKDNHDLNEKNGTHLETCGEYFWRVLRRHNDIYPVTSFNEISFEEAEEMGIA